MFPRRSRPQPQKDPSESTPLDPGMHDRHDIPNMQETPGDDGNTATPSSVPPFSSAGTSHRTPASSSHHNNDEESPAAPKRRRFDVGPPPRREPTNMCADILAGLSMITGFLHLSGTGGGQHRGFGDMLHNWSVLGSTFLASGNYLLTRNTKSLIHSNHMEVWYKLHGVHQDVLQELEEGRTEVVTLLIKVQDDVDKLNQKFLKNRKELYGTKDMVRELGADFHALLDVVRTLKENFQMLHETVNEMSRELDKVSETVTGLSGEVDELSGKVRHLSDEMHKMTVDVTQMTGKVNGLTEEVNKLRNDFNQFKIVITNKVDNLDAKVEMLDGKVEMLDGKVDNLAEDFKGFKDKMEFVVEYIRRTDSTTSG